MFLSVITFLIYVVGLGIFLFCFKGSIITRYTGSLKAFGVLESHSGPQRVFLNISFTVFYFDTSLPYALHQAVMYYLISPFKGPLVFYSGK